MVKLNKKTVLVILVVTALAIGTYWYVNSNSVQPIVNDASKDGLPATLDITKLVYNSSKVDGTYDKYSFFGNDNGTISLQSLDNVYSYIYSPKTGAFINKQKNP